MRRSLLAVAMLTLFWMALWETVSWANLLGGAAAAGFALWLAPTTSSGGNFVVRPLATVRLAGYFTWKLVEASLIVAWEVVTPRNRINEAVVAVPLRCRERLMITLLANSVSLTPGTVTLEATETPPTLYIHVLHLKTVEAVRRDVRRLEDLAIAALVADASAHDHDGPVATDRTDRPRGGPAK